MDRQTPPAIDVPLFLRVLQPFALVAIALAAVAWACAADAQEAPAAAPSLAPMLEQQLRDLALQATPAGKGGNAPRVEVQVGQLDPRLKLAPCQKVDAYLPEGMRPWGRSRVGLRCAQGAVKWNVYLPITVKVYAKALVAVNSVAANAVLGAGDVAQAEVDLAEDSSAALTDETMAVGRTLARPVRAGQSLRASHIKARQYFAAGESITVLALGPGFAVAGEGVALTPGVEGQAARVRTESGRVLTGQPTAERRMEIDL